ncbi:MAG: Crp/Fnr family transcriptional regulator, partial [Gammaproteobacteria bacterium]|nr:Crp/Fnr family transcriptional regulator [Gammaproteobacteria bacterium]
MIAKQESPGPEKMESGHLFIAGPCRHKPVEQRCIQCIVDSSSFFSHLSLPAKLALQKKMHLRRYNRRTRIYCEGDVSDHFHILMSGEVKNYKSLSNGHQQIYKLVIIPGDLIDCEDLFGGRYTGTAEALTPVSLCVIEKEVFKTIGRQYGEITELLLHSMSRNLNEYIRHIANLGQKS